MRLAFGSDHAGYELKERLKKAVSEAGHDVVDFGTDSTESVDYPDYAAAVGRAVAAGDAEFGILVCGTGLGMEIAANKIPGVRAASCSNLYEAAMARRHNDANVLCLGSRILAPEYAEAIVRVFLEERFEGGRHQKRIDKIARLEGQECGGREPA
jgi:ribose 5-phosphate isomerase B